MNGQSAENQYWHERYEELMNVVEGAKAERRFQAAVAAMQGRRASRVFAHLDPDALANLAVSDADALLKRLEK